MKLTSTNPIDLKYRIEHEGLPEEITVNGLLYLIGKVDDNGMPIDIHSGNETLADILLGDADPDGMLINYYNLDMDDEDRRIEVKLAVAPRSIRLYVAEVTFHA